MKLTKRLERQIPVNIYQYFKSGISLCLCLCLVLFSACQNKDIEKDNETTEDYEKEIEQGEQKIILPYSKEDSLNPFLAQSLLNISLSDLVYMKLYSLDDSFTPQPEIAAFSNNSDKLIKLNIQSDLYFSDNSNITAYDIVYSFNQAKASDFFAEKLINFKSAKVLSAYEISFELQKADPYAINLLDFPIVKNNSARRKEDMPIGSGSYVYKHEGEGISLELNPHSKNSKPKIIKIELIDCEDTSALAYDLETGKISAYYSQLNTKRLSRMYASFAPVYLNNFVFLGINQNNYALSFQKVRKAMSLSINRADVCGSAYQGNAEPAYTIYNPRWSVLESSEIDQSQYFLNYNEASKIFDEHGYALNKDTGIRHGDRGSLNFSLLVNSENEYKLEAANIIAESFLKAGIKININALPWALYLDVLLQGDYDLYLGEIKIPNNMDFSALLGEESNALFGLSKESEIFSFFDEYSNGSTTLEAFNVNMQDHMPLIPLCYTNGVLIAGKNIKGNTETRPSNIFQNIHNWILVSKK